MTAPAGRTCGLTGCHAPVPRPTNRYCCPDHTAAARNQANTRARAAAAERRTLQDALDGKSSPPEHVGWLTTTQGAVLTGQAVLELRAAANLLRDAARPAEDGLRPGVSPVGLRHRVKGLRHAADTAAEAVERVLRPGR